MADSHSGRDGVRVDDDVRSDAFTGERHVLQHNTVTLKNASPGATSDTAPPPGGNIRVWYQVSSPNTNIFTRVFFLILSSNAK